VEDDSGIELQVDCRGVGPRNGAHFIAAVVADIAMGLTTLVRSQQRQVAALVEQVARPPEFVKVYPQNPRDRVDAGEERVLADVSDLHGKSDFIEEGGDDGKNSLRQVQKVA